jgi:hypothetical protein
MSRTVVHALHSGDEIYFRMNYLSPFYPRPISDRFHSACLSACCPCIKSLTWHQNCLPAVNVVNLAFNSIWTVSQRGISSPVQHCNRSLGLTSFLPFYRQWTVSSFSSVGCCTRLSICRTHSMRWQITDAWLIAEDLEGNVRDVTDVLSPSCLGAIENWQSRFSGLEDFLNVLGSNLGRAIFSYNVCFEALSM